MGYGQGMVDIRQHGVWLIVALLVGSFLRVHGLAPLSEMLNFDEAFVGVDALSLVEAPRLQLYFPNNTGREGLWFYALAPAIALLGPTPFALRLVAIFTGIVTLAATYALGREVLGKAGGAYAAGGLAVLYWHVHLSHIPFRALLFVALAALALTALLKARRAGRGWVLAGVWLGLLAYTYAAARLMLPYLALWIAWWMWRSPRQRRGWLIMSAVAAGLAAPLGVVLLGADENAAHLNSLFVPDAAHLLDNIRRWLAAWVVAGDTISMHNLPGRPALDAPLLLLAMAGGVGGWRLVRGRWLLLWWAGLLLAGIAPSVLSVNAPHFLRGFGAVIPLALLLGAGGAWLAQWRSGRWLAIGLLAWAGANTYADFSRWLDDPHINLWAEDRVIAGMRVVHEQTDAALAVVMPGVAYDPLADYLNAAQPQRPIAFYAWPEAAHSCYLAPRREHVVLDLPIILSHFERRAQPYTQTLAAVARHPDQDYNVWRVQPNADLSRDWEDAAQVGDSLSLRAVEPLPQTVERGEPLTLHLGLRLARLPAQDLRIFAHLQGDPTPYAGGRLWATGDAPLCPLAYAPPPPFDATLVQVLTVPMPADLPAGRYHIAVGLYEAATAQRLPLLAPDGETRFYAAFAFALDAP